MSFRGLAGLDPRSELPHPALSQAWETFALYRERILSKPSVRCPDRSWVATEVVTTIRRRVTTIGKYSTLLERFVEENFRSAHGFTPDQAEGVDNPRCPILNLDCNLGPFRRLADSEDEDNYQLDKPRRLRLSGGLPRRSQSTSFRPRFQDSAEIYSEKRRTTFDGSFIAGVVTSCRKKRF